MSIKVRGQDISKVCRKAARVIEKDGLLKGVFGKDDGPKCAMGAVRYVVNGTTSEDLDGEIWAAVANTLFRAVRPRAADPYGFTDLTEFNDAKRRRKHDVVEVLRDIAAYAEAHSELPRFED